MKKYLLVFSIVIGLMFISYSVYASGEVTDSDNDMSIDVEVDAGITPDSKFLYKIDRFFERLSLKLTGSEEKLIEKITKYAEERLAEVSEMTDAEKSEFIDELLNDYADKISEASQRIAKLQINDKITGSRLAKVQNRIDRVCEVQERLQARLDGEYVPGDEVQNKLKRVRNSAHYIISAVGINVEEAKELLEMGFSYCEIIKLYAISDITELSIDELLALDIFIEDGTKVDQDKLATVLDITVEELLETIRAYKEAILEDKLERAAEFKGKLENHQKRLQERQEKINGLKQQFRSRIKEGIDKAIQEKLNNNGEDI